MKIPGLGALFHFKNLRQMQKNPFLNNNNVLLHLRCYHYQDKVRQTQFLTIKIRELPTAVMLF